MCLAVPAKLIEIDGINGKVETGGVKSEVRLDLMEGLEIGDYLIIHAGFALEKLDREEADKRLQLFEELAQQGFSFSPQE